MFSDTYSDPRIYCQYESLLRMRGQAHSFSLLPHHSSATVLAGRHGSRFRGRGLNFEELKHYQIGDDIRNLDWKVTMRTGKPHVRTYTEEKDHNVILCVDQGVGMFFSSVETMKSVVAAELGALMAWRALRDHDRVSFMIFNDDSVHWLKPTRSQKTLLHYLKKLSDINHSLSAKQSASNTFSTMIKQLAKVKVRNATIIVISDWSGCTEEDISHLKHLQRNNDVLGILISDPMEQNLFVMQPWVVSDGELQLAIDPEDFSLQHQVQAQHQLKRARVRQFMAVKSLPLIEVGTAGLHIQELKREMGGR